MNHQFTSEILHQNEYGYVSVCICCEEIQLGFGNILIQLPIQGLINLSEVMGDMAGTYDLSNTCCQEKLLIQTPQHNMFITVSIMEFERLKELLGQAIHMWEVRKLVSEK